MSDHVTLEQIAEVDAGVVGEPFADAVTEHVGRCPECSILAGQLAAVTHTLSSAPAEVIPPDVADALQATIAREVARRGPTAPPQRDHRPSPDHATRNAASDDISAMRR